MKKVLFAAFVGICVMSSIMATPANKGKIKHSYASFQLKNDSVPPPAPDTTHPKKDMMLQ